MASPHRPPDVPSALWRAIVNAAKKFGVDPYVLAGIWRIESGSTYPDTAVNSSGYGGLFGTQNYNGSVQSQANTSASILARLLRQTGGNLSRALSLYSGGAYTKVPGVNQGSSATQTGGGNTTGLYLPYNSKDTQGPTQIDEGLDFVSKSPYVAVAPGRVMWIDPNFYHHTPSVYIKLDQPISVNGRTYHGVYYAETKPLVHIGQHVNAGQNVIGPGDAEIGFAKKFGKGPSTWLPAAHNTYHEGQPTQAGNDFAQALQNSFQAGFKNAVVQSDPFQKAKTEAGAVAGFLGELTSAALWLRIGEVVGGGLLILLGLYLLTKQVGLGGFDAPIPQRAKDSADDAAGTVTPHANPAPSRRVVNQYYLDTPSGQTRRTRALAARGAERPSDDIPF